MVVSSADLQLSDLYRPLKDTLPPTPSQVMSRPCLLIGDISLLYKHLS